jgi:Transposase DDE domain
VDTDLDTLATALYATADDLLKCRPELVPWRPARGQQPQVSDAEMVTLAMLSAVLGFDSEARWVRYARARLRHLFSYLPNQPGYNKRLRRLGLLMDALIHHLAADTSVFGDDVLVVDSTPVECARSRETVKRSELAGWAEYGYCASHSRYFWGLRLHLVTTLHGLPIAYALTGAKADERTVLTDLIQTEPALTAAGSRTVIADKNYYGRLFEQQLATTGFTLLRKARAGEATRPGNRLFKPLRQTIESVFDTLKGQASLERHGGRTIAGVTVRVLQRLLAMTAAIWHNDHTGQPIRRSLTAYDH